MTNARPTERPRRRALVHNRDRDAEILAAARDVFEEKGFDAASVAEIARRARVAEGTIYIYAPTKRDLLMRVVAIWYQGLFEQIEMALAKPAATRQRLRWFAGHQFALLTRDAAIGRLLVRELRASTEYEASELHTLNQRYTRTLTDLLQAGIAAGDIRPGLDLGLARDLFFGAIEHAALGGTGRGRGVGAERIDRFVEMYWRAVGGSP